MALCPSNSSEKNYYTVGIIEADRVKFVNGGENGYRRTAEFFKMVNKKFVAYDGLAPKQDINRARDSLDSFVSYLTNEQRGIVLNLNDDDAVECRALADCLAQVRANIRD